MKSFKLIFLLVLITSFAVVMLQNQTAWEVRFLWMEGELPAIIMLFLILTVGFISGIIVSLLAKQDKQPKN